MCPCNLDYLNTTSADRDNGIVNGSGGLIVLESELESLGKSSAENKKYFKLIKNMSKWEPGAKWSNGRGGKK
jgi:hypothetical protein